MYVWEVACGQEGQDQPRPRTVRSAGFGRNVVIRPGDGRGRGLVCINGFIQQSRDIGKVVAEYLQFGMTREGNQVFYVVFGYVVLYRQCPSIHLG